MDANVIIVVLIAAVGGAIVLIVLWLLSRQDSERELEWRGSVDLEVRRWAARRGWAGPDDPDPELRSKLEHERRASHEVLAAAAGELAGRRAVLLLCRDEIEDGVPVYATVTLQMPVQLPELQVRQRYILATYWRAQKPAASDPSAGDRRFHRQLKIGGETSPSGAALLTGPVRAALLRLSEMGYGKWDFVDLREGALSVLLAGGPPALNLDLLAEAVSELVLALLDASDGDSAPISRMDEQARLDD